MVVNGQNGWGVTYTSPHICALKGSTVDISCTYTYPTRINGHVTTVEKTFWFIELQDKEAVDLRADAELAGRVQYLCGRNSCTLQITDLRNSDSAVYKFMFITNQQDGNYTDQLGVILSVKDLQVQTSESSLCKIDPCTWSELTCHGSCQPLYASYIWYMNGKKIREEAFYSDYFYSKDSVACAVGGYETFSSPSVCIYGNSCNKVVYTERSICAFRGSSVDISCTFSQYVQYWAEEKFWFRVAPQWQRSKSPLDLRKDSQYAQHTHLLEKDRGGSILRISDLKDTDSAEYRFTFKASRFEWGIDLPGTTLTVTVPHIQVQVIWSSTGPKLICHSNCFPPGHSTFVWYKNETRIQEETFYSYRKHIDPAGHYSCAYKGHRSLPVYAPKVPLVLMSSSGEIMRGSSVTLTCSSDANPAATYTWYKENQTLLHKETQLILSSIQSSDSGEYYCTAENELGQMASKYIFVNVKYGPEISSLSVSTSAKIVEGSSVNLTCSSDANPAATYTWFKENQTLLQGREHIYHFTSISSEDRGTYYCKSENLYGEINSTSLFLDVQYAPKLPSVSVSPSGEIVEGSLVNLTCSSDANPAATYTWYKEDEDSPLHSEQTFTITDFKAEHSGNYYCEAQNARGRHNSTSHSTFVAGSGKSAAFGSVISVLLAVTLITVLLWIRRNKCFAQQCEGEERHANRALLPSGQLNDVPSAERPPTEQQEELHYSSICFSQTHTDVLYSNIRRVQPQRHAEEDEEEEDAVEYTDIKVDSSSRSSGTRCHENAQDVFALHSTVNKNYVNTT
ncbi:sialic acid-binding Ig-like lectin 10 [Amphiprion ocellaris]|uniref:sialic acid-binding Ig-like lectin 10 n=1 Tax=Amphiprion ocellaris TaxID=80972 RepID=UPI00241160D1|nr:sialic acid-binding Ig-like lectin 10 [Amphiprion ocellaris]